MRAVYTVRRFELYLPVVNHWNLASHTEGARSVRTRGPHYVRARTVPHHYIEQTECYFYEVHISRHASAGSQLTCFDLPIA